LANGVDMIEKMYFAMLSGKNYYHEIGKKKNGKKKKKYQT